MVERVLIEVRGIVQGVGFRPYVHALATRLSVCGFVQNRGSHVLIDLEADSSTLDTFFSHLRALPPPAADIARVDRRAAPVVGHPAFHVAPSLIASEPSVGLSPDLATCDRCLAELFDPANRRYRHPFIACSDCGPRFTMASAAPYDRARTTMAAFEMCAVCAGEYADPADRRFHAQALACHDCGPRLAALGTGSGDPGLRDPIAVAGDAIRRGQTVAVKGLGGYHLACDATSHSAVSRLRDRKHRDAKPLAVMLREADVAGMRDHPDLFAILRSPQRPIVLIDRHVWNLVAGALAAGIADGSSAIGLMLPYTPVHHLLLDQMRRPLVMTSGNNADEPITYEDAAVHDKLRGIADVVLTHDRPIHVRCDDSVIRIMAGAGSIVRRARGYAPAAIALAEASQAPIVAVGGQLKNASCVVSGRHAYMSPHVGDLAHPAAYQALIETLAHHRRLLGVTPAVIAHDLHPDYLSTRLAQEMPAEHWIAVQHHHAHVLSCAAEHGVTEPVLGVVFDGAGLGTDGAIWGGEFLLVEGAGFTRLAHLGYVPLPGGDAAAREPGRMALSHLIAAYGDDEGVGLAQRIMSAQPSRLHTLRQMIGHGVSAPPTSSMGRLFDAVAALTGFSGRTLFEGQAAMQLESLVDEAPCPSSDRFDLTTSREPWLVHAEPIVRGIVRSLDAGHSRRAIATAFHDAVAEMIADVASTLARRAGVNVVALTGGVFQNAALTNRAVIGLRSRGLSVLVHRRVPCNDGGLALGQALAAARLARAGRSEDPPLLQSLLHGSEQQACA